MCTVLSSVSMLKHLRDSNTAFHCFKLFACKDLFSVINRAQKEWSTVDSSNLTQLLLETLKTTRCSYRQTDDNISRKS